MLSNTLNTNEIKNSAGVEQEFGRLSQNARSTEFGLLTETPALPHRLSISHQENGSGTSKVRRSVVRIRKTIAGQVDTTTPVVVEAYVVMSIPIGNMTSIAEATNALANLQSFVSTTGSGTTVLFDGSGLGAQCLLNGGL